MGLGSSIYTDLKISWIIRYGYRKSEPGTLLVELELPNDYINPLLLFPFLLIYTQLFTSFSKEGSHILHGLFLLSVSKTYTKDRHGCLSAPEPSHYFPPSHPHSTPMNTKYIQAMLCLDSAFS
jgi:hypothetical protein